MCARCGVRLRPLPGDCCVFCSYGDIHCLSKQLEAQVSHGTSTEDVLTAQDRLQEAQSDPAMMRPISELRASLETDGLLDA